MNSAGKPSLSTGHWTQCRNLAQTWTVAEEHTSWSLELRGAIHPPGDTQVNLSSFYSPSVFVLSRKAENSFLPWAFPMLCVIETALRWCLNTQNRQGRKGCPGSPEPIPWLSLAQSPCRYFIFSSYPEELLDYDVLQLLPAQNTFQTWWGNPPRAQE